MIKKIMLIPSTQVDIMHERVIMSLCSSLCFQRYPLLLRLITSLPLLYLPNTRFPQCHSTEGRTQMTQTHVLTTRFLYSINFSRPPCLFKKKIKKSNLFSEPPMLWQFICDLPANNPTIAPFTVKGQWHTLGKSSLWQH